MSQTATLLKSFLSRLPWKPLAFAGLAAVCISARIIISGDSGDTISYWLGLLAVSFSLLITAAVLAFTKSRRNALTLVGIAAISVFVSFVLFRYDYALRTSYRWTFHSGMYKQQLYARHDSTPGGLTYMDWDGWGFAGSETEVYLVHDPGDNLKHAVRSKYGVKAEGCTARFGRYAGSRKTGTRSFSSRTKAGPMTADCSFTLPHSTCEFASGSGWNCTSLIA